MTGSSLEDRCADSAYDAPGETFSSSNWQTHRENRLFVYAVKTLGVIALLYALKPGAPQRETIMTLDAPHHDTRIDYSVPGGSLMDLDLLLRMGVGAAGVLLVGGVRARYTGPSVK